MSLPPSPPRLPIAESRPRGVILTSVLSLVLLMFLASGVICLLDHSLLMWFHRQDLTMAAAMASLLMVLAGGLTCCLMALAPGIPKRVFLPVGLFVPVAAVAILPLLVYFSGHALWIVWCVSLGQVLLGLVIIHRVQGGMKFSWPLFPDRLLAERKFSWGNFTAVMLSAVFVLLPVLLLYSAYSAKLAVEHFTDGFVAVSPSGITMQVRKYARADGKAILLVPMSHIGEPEFYQELADSFPPDAVVLMEGVTDINQLAKTHSDYSKMANSVGGVEQTKVFKPKGEIVAADVDMSSFSPATLELLKVAMLVHSKGITAETMPILMKPTPPGLEKQLMEDILTKRNRHLLGVIRERLATSENIVVPWGAAHMPEIAREIQKSGFRVVETREYMAIRFGS